MGGGPGRPLLAAALLPLPPFEMSVLTGTGTVYLRGLRPMYLAGCFRLKRNNDYFLLIHLKKLARNAIVFLFFFFFFSYSTKTFVQEDHFSEKLLTNKKKLAWTINDFFCRNQDNFNNPKKVPDYQG